MSNKAAIDKLLDEVKWTPSPRPESPPLDGELYEVARGMVKIGNVELRVFQLNDGQRIIDADDMAKLFGVE